MAVNARALRRHPRSRRLATLLATVVHLEARATDDCLELLDLLMATELLGKAERESVKEKARQHPRLARASAKLATAVEVKDSVLRALSLPTTPDDLLAQHARTLDAAYRAIGGRLEANTAVSLDRDGQLHIERLDAIDDPASLTELRRDVNALLPRVDLPEVILEVMSWEPRFVAAFVAASGGQTRLADLHVTIAACLTAHALNIGYSPIAKKGVPALERDRISHVNQNYLGTETYAPANVWLIAAQAGIALAQAWGGGLVAGIDGMRFIVPVPSIYARPNRKYFGSKRGVTWLNMVNDQGSGLAAKVVSGTPGESLHMIDVIFSQDGGQRPDIIIADTGTYSNLVFGLSSLLDIEYRPELADMPDQRSWRIDPAADYGPLNTAARGRIDLDRVRRHWEDILRVIASIYTGTVRAYDVVRMLQRDGNPTPLGEAIASYGRIFKSLHILAYIDDETYRRDIKGVRNLQEGRTPSPVTSSTARKASYTSATTGEWKTSSARSASS
ncbi:MAG: Tn3 family transposase [Solirubrobacteraceae bacterium]